MKYAGPPRREIGIRTVFNIIGPLTNPADARAYLLGVADESLVEKLALVLQSLGCHHALVVHGEDGLDEISITAKTKVCELKEGSTSSYSISPEEFGLSTAGLEHMKGGTVDENAVLLRSILSGTHAAAAMVAGDIAPSIKQGVGLAQKSIDSGQALAKLEQLVRLSQSFT